MLSRVQSCLSKKRQEQCFREYARMKYLVHSDESVIYLPVRSTQIRFPSGSVGHSAVCNTKLESSTRWQIHIFTDRQASSLACECRENRKYWQTVLTLYWCVNTQELLEIKKLMIVHKDQLLSILVLNQL